MSMIKYDLVWTRKAVVPLVTRLTGSRNVTRSILFLVSNFLPKTVTIRHDLPAQTTFLGLDEAVDVGSGP
jgi:hypothetical protein